MKGLALFTAGCATVCALYVLAHSHPDLARGLAIALGSFVFVATAMLATGGTRR